MPEKLDFPACAKRGAKVQLLGAQRTWGSLLNMMTVIHPLKADTKGS